MMVCIKDTNGAMVLPDHGFLIVCGPIPVDTNGHNDEAVFHVG